MRCPFCDSVEDKVVDSREVGGGRSIRRRRECLECSRRFTTYEKIDTVPYRVRKKDGRRENFSRDKLLKGLIIACQKRPVPTKDLEKVADQVEAVLQGSPDREIGAKEIGTLVMERLKDLDQVAYVRFASVYRQFGDISEFMDEVRRLVEPHRGDDGE